MMTPKTIGFLVAFIFVGTTAASIMTAMNGQDIDVSPKFTNMLNTMETALENRKLITSNIQLISSIMKLIQQRISALDKQEERVINRDTRE